MSAAFEFAVCVPSHDGMPDVLDGLASALDQTHAPAEVVLVDDASSDGTAAAVAARFGDRVRVVPGRFGSAAAARNAAWRAARAPWIAFLDADDLWRADKLATAAALLGRHPECAWFFSDGAFRTLEGRTMPSWIEQYGELEDGYVGSPLPALFEVNFVLTSSVVARRDALEALGGFREDMTHAEDIELWIRLARRAPACASAQPLVRYQHRPGGLTRQLERRLTGSATLFERLAADSGFDPALRRAARRRAALARHKLAVAALREGRGADARAELARAWLFPERALPTAALWGASLLPHALLQRLRSEASLKRQVVAPMGRHRRIVVRASGGHVS